MLRYAATAIGIPFEHILAASIGMAIGRVMELSHVKLSLIAPMRDGPGEDQAIGNLVSCRHIDFQIKGKTLLAAVLDLSRRLRAREWRITDFLTDDADRIFLNIIGLPNLQCGATPIIEHINTKIAATKNVRNIAEMIVAQEEAEQWSMWIGFRKDVNGPAFGEALWWTMRRLGMEPLRMVFDPYDDGGWDAASRESQYNPNTEPSNLKRVVNW